MAIKELDGGQRHNFALTALRVTLTGSSSSQPARLRVVDQSGADSVAHRLGTTEVVLTPQQRRVRLMAVPDQGGAFAPGTRLGLTLRTEGAATSTEQVLVASIDVGALAECEFGVLEFAQTRAVLTVARVDDVEAPERLSTAPSITSGEAYAPKPTAGHVVPLTSPDTVEWLEQGRYALRDAEKLGTVGTLTSEWGLVLDGSASMRRLHREGHLQGFLRLVLGTFVVRARTWPRACVLAGVRTVPVATATVHPDDLLAQAFDHAEPASWVALGRAAAQVGDHVGEGGTVLLVTDGVPGDVENLVETVRARPHTRFVVVTTGVSHRGLPSDGQCSWWEEELAGFDAPEPAANLEVVAVRTGSGGGLELSGSRAAELALRLSGSQPQRVAP